MNIKILELRDRATFIPIAGFRIGPEQSGAGGYLLERAGYSFRSLINNPIIGLFKLSSMQLIYEDPGDRTFSVALKYIRENWDSIDNGEVIDVEFILGESSEKKISEMFS